MAPPKRSIVWKFFRILSMTKANCKLCGKEVAYSGNTTNLKQHIKRHHNSLLQPVESETRELVAPDDPHVPITEVDQATGSGNSQSSANVTCISRSTLVPTTSSTRISCAQPGIDEAFAFLSSFDSAGKRAKEITEAIVYMICKDNLPMNIVEGKGFLKLMKSVVPHFKVPSRKTIRKLINCKYEVEAEKMKNEIKATENYSLTTDIWTDTGNTVSYLGLTVHYLKNGSLKAGILGVAELRSNHTAEYLRNVIQGLCKEWNIDLNKVVAVVTDNGSNIKKAVKDLFGEEKHLSCLAHCIHLVATAGLSKVPDVQAIIGKVKTIVTFFKHSVVASDKLRQLQIDQSVAPNNVLKLKKDVPTRWNSTYYMIDRFIVLSNYVGSVLLQNPHSPPMLSGYELDVLREFRTILSPLEQITKELSGQKYVTVSLVIPLLNCLQTCLAGQIRETGEARNLSKSLMNELKLRFHDTESNKLYAVSTLLDPRFKRLHFRDSTALTRAINEVDQSIISSSEENIQQSSVSSNYEMNPNDIWSHHNSLLAKDGNINEETDTSLELRQFLAQRPHERNEDPVKVWSSIAAVYPNIAKTANKLMCVVATSVPAESMFSKAGAIARERRNRLTGECLSRLLFLNSLNHEQ